MIFVKDTWSLTDFIDLGDTEINTLKFEKKEEVAAHALAYFVKGVISNLRYSSEAYSEHSELTLWKMLHNYFWKQFYHNWVVDSSSHNSSI